MTDAEKSQGAKWVEQLLATGKLSRRQLLALIELIDATAPAKLSERQKLAIAELIRATADHHSQSDRA
jgi:hypothetical protein